MPIEIKRETEALLNREALKRGISVDELLEQVMERAEINSVSDHDVATDLPVAHMGSMGALHRREIYDDVG